METQHAVSNDEPDFEDLALAVSVFAIENMDRLAVEPFTLETTLGDTRVRMRLEVIPRLTEAITWKRSTP